MGPRVLPRALRIRLAAMSGWAMNAACDPSLTDSILAFIRLDMNRSQSGGMALSCSETMYQVGRFFQPATVAFSVRAAALSGRWLTAIGAATSAGRSAQNVWWNS